MTGRPSTRVIARFDSISRHERTAPLFFALATTSLILYGLARPNALFGVVQYDDGVYFDSAVRLVSGSIPYRDFVMVQPPGIAVLFAPLALVARHIGTRDGLAIARGVTALICGANVYLIGRLLKDRGRLVAGCASAIVALFPAAVFADRTLLLEPFVVFFALLGARKCLLVTQPVTQRDLFIAGLWFGAATSVKLWAVVLVAAILAALLLPGDDHTAHARMRVHNASVLLAGVATTTTVVCAPFLLAAPSAFVHDVVTAQLTRHTGSTAPIWLRLTDVVGVDGTGSSPSELLGYLLSGVLAFVVFLGGVVAMLRRRTSTAESFVLVAAVLGTFAILVPSQYFNHYAYFVAPFVVASVVLSVSRLGARLRLPTAISAERRTALLTAIGCVFLAGASTLVVAELRFDNSLVFTVGDPSIAIDLAIPIGACAISDATVLLVEANRATPSAPTCPALVDATGLWLATAPKEAPLGCETIAPPLVSTWKGLLQEADFFVESGSNQSRVPWTVGLRAWFKRNYRHIPDPGAQIFVRTTSSYVAAELNPARWSLKLLISEGWHPPTRHGKSHAVRLPRCLSTRV